MTTVSSREFNHDVSAAKRAAAHGPVVITDRGVPSHVLLTYAEFQRLRGGPRNLAEILADRSGHDVDFDPGRVPMEAREVDL